MDSRKPLTAGEIEELKSLDAKATPGPWAWEFTGDDNMCAVGTVMDENENFIAGMVGQDADTVVVDSVCPEVTNQQDAAFIAAARNALPRLLSLLTPPPDAAVREVVNENRLHEAEQRVRENYFSICARHDLEQELRIALASLRAVQSPRLTGEQMEVVRMPGYTDKTCRTCGKTSYCTEQGKMALYGFMIDCPMWCPRVYTTTQSVNSGGTK